MELKDDGKYKIANGRRIENAKGDIQKLSSGYLAVDPGQFPHWWEGSWSDRDVLLPTIPKSSIDRIV